MKNIAFYSYGSIEMNLEGSINQSIDLKVLCANRKMPTASATSVVWSHSTVILKNSLIFYTFEIKKTTTKRESVTKFQILLHCMKIKVHVYFGGFQGLQPVVPEQLIKTFQGLNKWAFIPLGSSPRQLDLMVWTVQGKLEHLQGNL